MKHKHPDSLLYYKDDTHWTHLGGKVGYEAIMKVISKRFDVEKIDLSQCVEETWKGDLLSMMSGLDTIAYSNIIYKKPAVKNYFTIVEQSSGNSDFIRTNCPGKKYKVFILRDSFFNFMFDYFSNTFYEVTYMWKYELSAEDVAYIKDNADIVILESVERFLPAVMSKEFPK